MFFKVLFFATVTAVALAQTGYEDEEDFNDLYESKPYSFGYAVKDIHGEQHREESRDKAGTVTGSYSYVDESGIRRTVYYIADHRGFRAKVVTNEPGTSSMNPANVLMESIYR